MTSTLRCNIADLLARPASRRVVHLEADAEELGGIGTVRIDPGAPILVDVALERVPDGVVVHGTVRASVSAPCSRCLTPVHEVLEVPVRELFEPAPLEGQTYPLEGEELDLDQAVRDNLLLDLPRTPLCRDDCAGLCPMCGIDRNEADCDCDLHPPDPRWDALRALELTD